MALNLPTTIQAGDSLQFTATFSDYRASDGWALTIHLSNHEAGYTLTSTASGDDYAVSIAASVTATYTAGEYSVQAVVTKGAERFTVAGGRVRILANAMTGPVDQRTHVERTLEKIEAAIEGLATQQAATLTINGRTVTYTKLADLLTIREKYRAELKRIRAAENIAAGKASGFQVRVRL